MPTLAFHDQTYHFHQMDSVEPFLSFAAIVMIGSFRQITLYQGDTRPEFTEVDSFVLLPILFSNLSTCFLTFRAVLTSEVAFVLFELAGS